LIYTLIKLPIRLALRIFCVDIDLVNPGYRSEKGPLLLVANHPNSFLDAILIAAQFREPVYFLARGDAFRKPWQRFLLGLLHMVPIYRLSEGRENLHLNEYAFKQSQALLTEGKIVLIFIEGICLNTHELQPFKKGAARIALTAVGESLPLNIMPVSLSYNNFTSIGKTVRIELSKLFSAKEILIQDREALNMQYFNRALFLRLDSMIKPPEPKQQKGNIIFFLFSVAGYFLHLPLYSIVKKVVRKKTRQTVFYDSVLFGVLLLLYPLYLLLLFALLALLHVPIVLIVLLLFIHPMSAWFAVRYKIKSQTSS
jgi:1-acyl-sn-glycerol-3-phosphate acyltransferase